MDFQRDSNPPSGRRKWSLLERASARLNAATSRPEGAARPQEPAPMVYAPRRAGGGPAAIAVAEPAVASGHMVAPLGVPSRHGRLNYEALQQKGFLRPNAPPTSLAEEFRRVKRQLLVEAGRGLANGRIILVCSAQQDEGKTFCAVNLALSMADERDLDVLLVDTDCAKPEVMTILGLNGGPGLIDALTDPSIPLEDCIIQTDIPNLHILPAGRLSHGATELLASRRAEALFARLVAGKPNRIVICDSAPALCVSTASVVAMHAGQVLLIVRADKTVESEIQEALVMLKSCATIHLLLNGVTFSPFGRQVGKEYGYGE